MLTNNLKKYIRSLHQSKYRQKYNKFLAEGPKVLHEILSNNALKAEYIVCDEKWFVTQQLESNISREIILVDKRELDAISCFKTSNACLAVIDFPAVNTEPDPSVETFILYLDGVQDPGNMGSIIRTAEWFGLNRVYYGPSTASFHNPKVVQASMGSVFRTAVIPLNLIEFAGKNPSFRLIVSALDGQQLESSEKIEKSILVIGNESRGVGSEIMTLADETVKIFGKGSAESLNASVATGILLNHYLGL